MSKKHLVWNNDVCELYDEILKSPRDFFPEMEDDEEISDDKAWDKAYDLVNQYLDDEEMNLDINVGNNIFLMGTLVRWNGSRAAYADLGTCNIGKALHKAISKFDGDNSFEIYVEGGKLLISQSGHDNPTSPSIMEFRVPKSVDSVDDMLKDDSEYMRRNSKGLAREVCKVYGWSSRRKAKVIA